MKDSGSIPASELIANDYTFKIILNRFYHTHDLFRDYGQKIEF